MSYEVSSRAEVKQKLKELGVDSVADVRRADGAYKRDLPAVIDAERLALRADGSPDSMAAMVAELRSISAEIGKARDEVGTLLAEAGRLGGHQFDGWGPISDRMKQSMTDRAGHENGAQHALTSYVAELAGLEAVLSTTASLYDSVEQTNVNQLKAAERGNGQA